MTYITCEMRVLNEKRCNINNICNIYIHFSFICVAHFDSGYN